MQGGKGFEESTRISEGIVAHVRQCHVSYTEWVQLSQDRNRIPDLVGSGRC